MQRTFAGEFWKAKWSLLNGFLTTIELSLLVIAIGLAAGVIGGLLLVYGPRPVRWLMRAYVDILRGIPILVLILFSYYGLALMGIDISAFTAGVVALAGFCSAHMSETFRGAIDSIPVGQTEAAKAIGLTFWQRFFYVLLPQAARRIAPPAINTAVEMVKGTTLLSIIGVSELLLATQQTIARNYMVIEFYASALAFYFIFNFTLSRIGAYFERRFGFIRY
jgi:polar amino acid transport system permease protein